MDLKRDKVPFEEALTLTGFGKFNLLMFMLCGVIIIGMGFELFSVSYIVPASACELGTTSAQQGLMAGVPLIGVICTSHVWGYLADTRGRRKIIVISMTLAFIGASLSSLSPNWIVLSVFKFISCTSVGSAFALSLTLLSECMPSSKRSFYITLTNSIFLSAIGCMAVIAMPILPLKFSYYVPYLDIQLNSWRLLNLIYSLPSLLGAIGVACAYESPKYLVSIGNEEEALKILKKIFVINEGKSQDLYPVSSVNLDEDSAKPAKGFLSSMLAQTVPMMKPPLLKSTLLLSTLYIISYMSMNPFTVWLPFIVNSVMTSVNNGYGNLTMCEMIRMSSESHLNLEQPSNDCSMNEFAMTMVFGIYIILAILNTISSTFIRYIGRKKLFIALQVTSGICALCTNISTIWILNAALFVVYLTSIINFGILTAYSVDIFPTYVKAMAVCLTLMAGRGSAVLGINALKVLLDVNCEAAFYIFGSVATVGGVIGLLLPPDSKLTEQNNSKENSSKDMPPE